MVIKKVILKGKEARQKLLVGVDYVADIVGKTLGPSGRNTILSTMGAKAPKITNDGISIAQEIVLDDEIEDLGAQTLINAAHKTNDRAGDGTTTTIVLARQLVNDGLEKIDDEHSLKNSSVNVMNLYREINELKTQVIEKLKKMAKPIKTKADYKKIAVTSVENDEVGGIIADMLDKLGKDAVISVEAGFDTEIHHDIVKGMKLHGSYASELLVTNDRKEAIKKDISVVVTNYDIETPQQLIPIVEALSKAGKTKVALFAPKFDKSIIPTIVVNKAKGIFDILPLKVPALTDAELEDIAVYTRSTFFDKNKDADITKIQLENIGNCDQIIANADDIAVLGGPGNVNARLKKLREEKENEKTDMMKLKYDKRIASLSGGIGVISVGGRTDIERNYLRLKIEDAVYATKAAIEEGVVPGGGLALQQIAKELGDNILTKTLNAPYEQIKDNAGGNIEIDKDVLDPVKVTRIALENACSVAGILLTTESAIADKKVTDVEESYKKLIDDVMIEMNNG
jgi:chaperonin GroEL